MINQSIKYLLRDKNINFLFMINVTLLAAMLFVPSVALAEEPYISALTSVLHYSGDPFVDEYNFCETNGCTASVLWEGHLPFAQRILGPTRYMFFQFRTLIFLNLIPHS